jgi:glycosyltransferase involved in cell wall biosynthesis
VRVLVAHNDYRSDLPSGENLAVRGQIDALRAAGVHVVPYLRSSDEIGAPGGPGRVRTAVSALGAASAIADIAALIEQERPDVVHLHNPYPLISPRIVAVAQARGVPVVQTAHNFRHVCVAGTFFRDGRACHDCVGHRIGHPGVRHACYRGSRAQSAVMAAALAAHRPHIRRLDRVVALTPALLDHLVGYGVPPERITVLPNTVADPGPVRFGGGGVLFAGRLSPEKGIGPLAAAWTAMPEHAVGRLTIAGDGPDRAIAVDLAGRRADVEYLGPVAPERVAALIQASALVVVPSQWEEICPLIVVESLAHGRPVLATDRGGLPYLVGSDGGWIVAASAAGLRAGLQTAGREAAARSPAARARYLRELAPTVLTARLIEMYTALSGRSRS